ncbi:transcription factor CP2-like [Sphaerodactylus townsendi]|uniref:transcription factor CP2-like n=1 Tax=Sphaerodactylus townsendi TaxID=933632 RepID=UPI0020264255|nr:transcription factor CP2-like [Sphaerodactylus townsendi]
MERLGRELLILRVADATSVLSPLTRRGSNCVPQKTGCQVERSQSQPPSVSFCTSRNGSPNHQPEPPAPITDNLLPTTTPQEAQQWLLRNRFSTFSRLFTNFSGADLLKLTREDVIQICGPADGIRLFNALKGRYVTSEWVSDSCWKLLLGAAIKTGLLLFGA